jgi:hypothetical protein
MKKYFALLLLTLILVSNSFAVTFTKTQAEALDWTQLQDTVSDNPFAETTIQTFASHVEVVLNIVVAHLDTNDASTNDVTVSVLIRASDDGATEDEGWRLFTAFAAGAGQATTEALNANSGVSQGNPERIEVASTADFDTGTAEWLFLKDAGTLANSALVLVEGWADNDYYINAWDLERDYDNADALYNLVDQIPVRIPAGAQFINVTFHNSDDDANYAVRVDYTAVTAIE